MLGYHVTEAGRGVVEQSGDGLFRLTVPPAPKEMYHNAQISSYVTRRDLQWKPPVRMTVRARAEVEGDSIQGTAGFGFWNHPFAPNERSFRLPRAVWFFYASPPSDMQLARGVPGHGWKAATFDAIRWQFFALLPTAPVGFLLMHIPALYERLWPIGQRAIGVSEHPLDSALLDDQHEYTVEWRVDRVTFMVDGDTVHESDCSPGGPLGLVAWIDNQYAVVTPRGRFGFGLLDVLAAQSLLLESLHVEAIS